MNRKKREFRLIVFLSIFLIAIYGVYSATSDPGDPTDQADGDGNGNGDTSGDGICGSSEGCSNEPACCSSPQPPPPPPPPPPPSCAGNAGASCNCGACGCGTVQCNGACSGGGSGCCSGSMGQSCNCGPCGCGGTVQCDGGCSGGNPTPGNYGQGCGNCGSINCAGSCANQGPCSPEQVQCASVRYQSCNSGCQWQNSGTDADGDGTDSQCGDSLCDNNPSFVNSNRRCTPGKIQCNNDRYQDCPNCDWNGIGTNADNDAKDFECGDSLCDNAPGVYDSTKTASETACSDGLDNDCDGATDCNDTDCDGSITGIAKNKDSNPISDADVSAKKDLTTVKSSATNSLGNYNIAPIACGTYNIVASHPDYAPKTQAISLAPNQQMTLNFEGMVIGTSCEPDCTFAFDETIHASCDGKNGCAFFDGASKAACDNSQPGWLRDYNSTHYIVCASGAPQPKIEIKASVSCASGTLVKITSIVLYNGKPVKLVVATCG